MKRSSQKPAVLLASAYEKHLLGAPLDKLGLTDTQLETIELFERFDTDGRTACQISEESRGMIPGTTAAVLRKVKKSFRTKVKTVLANRNYRQTCKVLEKSPEYKKFVTNQRSVGASGSSLPEVFAMRLEGYGVKKITEAGGQPWQSTKATKLRMLFDRGNLKTAEIADAARVTVSDVRKCLKIYKAWRERNKIDELV